MRHAAGTPASVHAIFAGAGLPKPPAHQLEIGAGGVVGDVNRFRVRRDGDPDMAVSLLAIEIITRVAWEGWAEVVPGALGENVTTIGLDPDALAGDQKLRIGSALVELSRPMEPCRTLTALVGAARLLPLQKTLRGRRGWYARVVEPGVVRSGDVIVSLGSQR